MAKRAGWLGRLGNRLSRMEARLQERRAEVEAESILAAPVAVTAGGAARTGVSAGTRAGAGAPAAHAPTPVTATPAEQPGHPHPPAQPGRPDPVSVVPWGMRVAAEVSWRLLLLAGMLWVVMKVISEVRLVVLAFAAALLVTALLQPFVVRLRRLGLPRGLATAVTAILGFVVIGLVGWFVVWQVMENLDDLSARVRDGINELKLWALDSPFHVTEKQINDIAKNLSETIGTNTEQITSAGLQGVTVLVEVLTGILLAMFSTLFLLYDGKRIWTWVQGLVPAAARPGVAGAGPRAWRTLTAYVRGTVLVALIDAIFIGLGIYFLKVPMAVPLAVFIFLFAFIPLVGAVVSGALAVVVALVTQGPWTALMVLLVVLAVQQIEGHVLQPFILGRAVRVHPLAVVLSVAAGGMIAGIGGAVVAVPLVAVTNTVVVYLRAYSRDQLLRGAAPIGPGPHGSTAFEQAVRGAERDQRA
ncbi:MULTISPECIES: AI-2E family transporter [unclassified Streptomyces]|uniref:AI-2E family transporter n=1 Tax=unclassified Streptomyces TaxID=2593676 RepID=UPI002254AC1A|nr:MULTISPECIES: AI-2E family transporter [unclassified Streptomyces]MCX5145705.1 AI-2E family transporter [Streptomyces sp. NBC_00320]WSN48965.1 AI-2E family transporter [Streptomyces sp. NBC_01296]WSW61626.1 AI-2E family transporter [Streptomyces sp. NBC_00998]